MPHWEAYFLKVPRETGTWEPLGILELPSLGSVVPSIDGSPEELPPGVQDGEEPQARGPGPHRQAVCPHFLFISV